MLVGSVKLSAPRIHSLLPSPGNQVLLQVGVLSSGCLESAFLGLWKALTSVLTELGAKLPFLQR